MRITESMRLNIQCKDDFSKMSHGKSERIDDCPGDDVISRDEKLKLQAIVSDLTKVNRRWQRYNCDMQTYIKRLQTTIEDQQEQINNMADINAEEIIQSKKSSERDGDFMKCRLLIKSLRERIAYLESQLYKRIDELRETNHHVEILSLQLKLSEASHHMQYKHRPVITRGVLELNMPSSPRQMVNPFSINEQIFYECDTGSFENFEDVPLSSKGTDTEKMNAMPSTSSVGSSSVTHVCNISEDSDTETSATNIQCQPYNIGCSSPGSIDVNNKLVDLDVKDNSSDVNNSSPLIDHQNIFSLTEKIDTKNIIGDRWDLSDIFSKECLHSRRGDITCPHCLTVFPPDSEEAFKQHIETCVVL